MWVLKYLYFYLSTGCSTGGGIRTAGRTHAEDDGNTGGRCNIAGANVHISIW